MTYRLPFGLSECTAKQLLMPSFHGWCAPYFHLFHLLVCKILLIKQIFLLPNYFFSPTNQILSKCRTILSIRILESLDTYSLTSRSWSTSWGFVKSGSCASKWIIYGTTYSGSKDSNFSTVTTTKNCFYITHIYQRKTFSKYNFFKHEM